MDGGMGVYTKRNRQGGFRTLYICVAVFSEIQVYWALFVLVEYSCLQ